MSPKTQHTREDILSAALDTAIEHGFDGITIRAVADRLGCSVAPIYVNFKNRDALIQAVLKRGGQLLNTLIQEANTGIAYLDIGAGLLMLAKKYPQICMDLHYSTELTLYTQEELYTSMRQFDLMRDATVDLLEKVHDKVKIFTFGMAMGLLQGMWADTPDEELIALLKEAGEDIMYAQAHRQKGRLK